MESNEAPINNKVWSFPESNTHSFIIKVWLEEISEDIDTGVWRGQITHVLSGQHRYVKSLQEMISFMEHYFEGMGATLRGPSHKR